MLNSHKKLGQGDSLPFGAEIKNFDPSLYMDRKGIRRTDPDEHFAVATAKQALAHSGLKITEENADGKCSGDLGGR
jgi:3-oxoacyl-[acyl-carrier-protein] synthase II